MAQGIFGGTAILVSYLWGVLAFEETPKNIFLSLLGVGFLIVGVLCIAFNRALTRQILNVFGSEKEPLKSSLLLTMGGDEDSRDLLVDLDVRHNKPFASGVFWALVTGTAGGSVLVPLHYAPSAAQGLAFVPSLGIGAIVSALLVACLWFFSQGAVPESSWQVTLPVGILSGTLFNISNVLAIISIPELGYAVAYPILQCALFVAGLWGIFFFNEIKEKEIVIFFLSGFILLAGAISISIASS